MNAERRRERLEQLLNLAQMYQGWNRTRLAQALGRDSTRLVPESGLPKLDLIMDLTRVLDWSVGDVAGYLWGEGSPHAEDAEDVGTLDFDSAESRSKAAHREGHYAEAVKLAERAYRAAETGEQRATAAIRESSAWDGLGRYLKALEATKRGLAETDVSDAHRLLLQANLAIEYYTLWQLLESKTISQDLIHHYDQHPPTKRIDRVSQALAHYVRGNDYRRLIGLETTKAGGVADQAKHDLILSSKLHDALADEFDEEAYRGVANTCRGALIEVDTALGECSGDQALAQYAAGLNSVVNLDECPGDWVESYGWWCIFGCNVALRHLTDPRSIQKHMALFTNKADEIAERLDNWAIRERVFSMDYARRQRFSDWTGVPAEWTIDKSDVRVLTGTMGVFPAFQKTGWEILQSAQVVGGS